MWRANRLCLRHPWPIGPTRRSLKTSHRRRLLRKIEWSFLYETNGPTKKSDQLIYAWEQLLLRYLVTPNTQGHLRTEGYRLQMWLTSVGFDVDFEKFMESWADGFMEFMGRRSWAESSSMKRISSPFPVLGPYFCSTAVSSEMPQTKAVTSKLEVKQPQASTSNPTVAIPDAEKKECTEAGKDDSRNGYHPEEKDRGRRRSRESRKDQKRSRSGARSSNRSHQERIKRSQWKLYKCFSCPSFQRDKGCPSAGKRNVSMSDNVPRKIVCKIVCHVGM